MVRMGEIATSTEETLVCVGLGSCIGLVLVERRTGNVGLAHVMLPSAGADVVPQPGRYADTVLPAILREMGAHAVGVDAFLVGGAAMFGLDGSTSFQDVGRRNEAGVRAALDAARIRVIAAHTGGSKGRTVRATPGRPPEITVRVAGEGVDVPLTPSPTPLAAAA